MSIRAKLFFLFFFALIALGGVLHLYWLPHYVDLEESHARREQRAYLDLLGASLLPAVLSSDLAQVHHTLNRVLRDRPMWRSIRLVNAQREVLYPLGEPRTAAPSEPLSEILVVISDEQGIVGWLSADVDMKAILAQRHAEIVKLEWVFLAVLALTALCGGWFADRWVRRPISALASAAGRIAQGDYSAPLGRSTRDEIGELTKVFERMRAIVQRREADIGAQNRTLSAIRDAQTRYIREASFESAFEPLLIEATRSSGSSSGLIAEVVSDGAEHRYLHGLLVTTTAEQAEAAGEMSHVVLPLEADDELLARVVDGVQTLFLTALPRATSLLQVYKGDQHVVAAPLRAMGAVIGVFVLAGRPQRYTDSDIDTLRPVTSTCANLLNAMQGERDRLSAVERVSETASRMSAIFDTMVDGVITTRRDGTIESVNPAVENIFGYTEAELIGQNVKALMPEPYRSEHDSYVHNYVATGERKIIGIGREVQGLRKNGEIFPLELGISEIEVGGMQLFTGIVRDVTERKRVDRMKNEFISTVSHELRTPLTAIRGALGLIASAKLGDVADGAMELVQLADKNAERLVRLINDILDIEKMEAGKMHFHLAEHDLVTVIQHAVAANRSYAAQSDVHLSYGDMPAKALAHVDADRVRQVLDNLLSNAIKFSPARSEVRTELRFENSRWVLSVSDQGPGIPDDFRPRLFQKFSQSDSSDSRARGGTGLGLSICRAIVDRHQGDISIECGPEGGTTVYVSIPADSVQLGADATDNRRGCPVAKLHRM